MITIEMLEKRAKKDMISSFILVPLMYIVILVVSRCIIKDSIPSYILKLLIILAIYFYYAGIKGYKDFRRFIKNISPYLSQKKIILFDNTQFILTDDCIIDVYRKTFYQYNEILLAYVNHGTDDTAPTLEIFLKNGRYFSYVITDLSNSLVSDNKYLNYNLLDILKEKNPNILVGNTKENRKILFEKYDIKLDSKFIQRVKSIILLPIIFILMLLIIEILS